MILLAQTSSPASLSAALPGYSGVGDVLRPYLGVFLTALVASLLLTPVLRWLALANGVVDRPDYQRKQHRKPVAYLGGVAIFLAWGAGVALSLFVSPHNQAPAESAGHVHFPLSIILGATVITVAGLLDDVYKASPRVKIGGQLIAAAMLAMENVGINLVTESFGMLGWQHPHPLLCYVLGTAVIAFFVLGGCNSMNLLDGLDGLAAGVGTIAALGFLFLAVNIALTFGSPELAGADPLSDPVRVVMCLALIGALLGFLPYNFNPARIFMGDAGSLLLGYLCVSTILLFAHAAAKGPAFVMAALLVFALPITDTLLAIFRRRLRGQSIARPDSEHLHHQLRRRGFSVRQTALLLYAAAAGCAVLGGAMVLLRIRQVLVVFLLTFGAMVVVAYRVGLRQAHAPPPEPAGPATPTPPPAESHEEPAAR